MSFEQEINSLVRDGGSITVSALGGLEAIPQDATRSPLFPLVAGAIVTEVSPNDVLADEAKALLVGGIANATSALALSDTCKTVVPAAAGFNIVLETKDALHTLAKDRSTDRSAGLASEAMNSLGHLAVLNESARPAFIDVLTGVAVGKSECLVFAITAARLAGVAYDHWKDQEAIRCLERLTESDAEADAWFHLGQTQLLDSLAHTSEEEILGGLKLAIPSFQRSEVAGEARPDASLYLSVARFLTDWGEGAGANLLEGHAQTASEALSAFVFGGKGMPPDAPWYRPRFDSESRWVDLVLLLRKVAGAGERSDWYEPPIVLKALADAYQAAHCLPATRTGVRPLSSNLAHIVEPRVAAPFIDGIAPLAWLDKWTNEIDHPYAEALSSTIRQRVKTGKKNGTHQVAPDLKAVADLLEVSSLEGDPKDILKAIDHHLADKTAAEKARTNPVVEQLFENIIAELVDCPDFRGQVRERFEGLVHKVILFLHSRMNAQHGDAGGRFAYLFDPDALEKRLGFDLKEWLEGNYPGQILAEVQEIAGGRTDLIVQCDYFRLVMELKREKADASRKALEGYLPQVAAYESVDIALAMLIVLDLTSKPTGPPNIRDNAWVEVVAGPNEEDSDRYVVTVRIPGNRKSPSDLKGTPS